VEWLPGLLDVDKATFHSCCRPMSPDDVPIVGPLPYYRNVYVNSGHGSKGWTLTHGSAKLLADIITGKQTAIDMAPFTPDRFQSWWQSMLNLFLGASFVYFLGTFLTALFTAEKDDNGTGAAAAAAAGKR
jgi:hypothetical protein